MLFVQQIIKTSLVKPPQHNQRFL